MHPANIFLGISLASVITVTTAQEHPAPVQFLESEGVRIIESFEAPAQLTGYVAEYDGRTVELYVTADGEYAILGTLIDSRGDAVSQAQLQRGNASATIDWESLATTHWLAEGDMDADQVIYVFTDPNCPFCAQFWEAAQPYLAEGGIQLRHIMVGVLRQSSVGKAATVLAAQSQVESLQLLEHSMMHDDMRVADNIPDAALQQVMQNNDFMRRHNIHGTPAVIFKDPTGAIQQVQGLPSENLMENFIFAPPAR